MKKNIKKNEVKKIDNLRFYQSKNWKDEYLDEILALLKEKNERE